MKHLYLNDDDSLTIPKDVLDSLDWAKNAELAYSVEDGRLVLSPTGMCRMELDLSDELLIHLAKKSVEEEISVNEVLTNMLTAAVEYSKTIITSDEEVVSKKLVYICRDDVMVRSSDGGLIAKTGDVGELENPEAAFESGLGYCTVIFSGGRAKVPCYILEEHV